MVAKGAANEASEPLDDRLSPQFPSFALRARKKKREWLGHQGFARLRLTHHLATIERPPGVRKRSPDL